MVQIQRKKMYISSNNCFFHSAGVMQTIDTLPPKTFVVQFDGMKNEYYPEVVESSSFSTKIYGDTTKIAERILNTFRGRPATTGVLLAGEKDTGKTMLAKLLSVTGGKEGYPTILINAPHQGDVFNKFIQKITQPAIIILMNSKRCTTRKVRRVYLHYLMAYSLARS